MINGIYLIEITKQVIIKNIQLQLDRKIITGGVGGAEEGPPTCKMGTFFSNPLQALTMHGNKQAFLIKRCFRRNFPNFGYYKKIVKV